MKLKTVEDLSDKLDYEISWRRVELTNLKFNIENIKGSTLSTNLRSSLVLLYAHWEGFVKKSLTYYLEYVSNQKLNNNQLKYNFFALEISHEMEEFSKTKKNTLHTKIIESIFDKMSKKSSIPFKNKIDTKSNLNSNLFEELMFSVGLETLEYQTYYKIIDERLLGTRNQIAHGEALQHLQLTKESYLELHEIMKNIIEKLKEQIVEAAINKSYMIRSEEYSDGCEPHNIVLATNENLVSTESGAPCCQYRKPTLV